MTKKIISVFAIIVVMLAAFVVWNMAPFWAEELDMEQRWFDMAAGLLFIIAFVPSVFLVDDESDDDDMGKMKRA